MNPITTLRTSEPVVTNGAAASLGAALIPVLVYLGVQSDKAGRIGSIFGAVLAGVGVLWHLWSARSKVMPVEGNVVAELLADAKQVLEALQQLPTPATPISFHAQIAPPVQWTPTTTSTVAVPPAITGGVVELEDGTLAPAAPPGLEDAASGAAVG